MAVKSGPEPALEAVGRSNAVLLSSGGMSRMVLCEISEEQVSEWLRVEE